MNIGPTGWFALGALVSLLWPTEALAQRAVPIVYVRCARTSEPYNVSGMVTVGGARPTSAARR